MRGPLHAQIAPWRDTLGRVVGKVKPAIIVLAVLALATAACGQEAEPIATPVPFQSVTFEVQAGGEYRLSLEARSGHLIEFRFNVDLDIDLIVLDPTGSEIGHWDRVESHSGIQKTAEHDGIYTLIFDNSFSFFTPKSVQVDYRVVPSGGK